MVKKFATFLATCAVALPMGCTLSIGPRDSLPPQILFTGASAVQPGPHGIYGIQADGKHLVRLTDESFGDALDPRWSPDRQRFGFIASSNSPYVAWIMDTDLKGAHALPNPERCSAFIRLSWSPTGDRILGDCEMVEQFVVKLSDGTNYSLTQQWGNVADFPDWSPVDDRILYLRGPNYWIANLDGSGATVVATDASQAAWSPDGKRIAFVRFNENQSEVIWVANADGTGAHQVTFPVNRTITDESPAWSPDGSRIVFERIESENPKGLAYLCVMNADGSGLKRITPETLLATRPDW